MSEITRMRKLEVLWDFSCKVLELRLEKDTERTKCKRKTSREDASQIQSDCTEKPFGRDSMPHDADRNSFVLCPSEKTGCHRGSDLD